MYKIKSITGEAKVFVKKPWGRMEFDRFIEYFKSKEELERRINIVAKNI